MEDNDVQEADQAPGRRIPLRRRFSEAVYDRAQVLLNETVPPRSAAEIARQLDDELGAAAPDERTVADWRKKRYIAVDSEDAPWSLAHGDADEAALVLPLVRALNERRRELVDLGWTDVPRRRPTRRLARWVVRIRRAAPDLSDLPLVLHAAAVASRGGEDLERVETFLAYAPWRDDGAALFAAASAGDVSHAVIDEFGYGDAYANSELTWPKEQARRERKANGER